MKRFFSILMVCVAAQMGLSAQNSVVKTDGYLLPKTAITAQITICKESVVKGPYAKYSQQYLGVSAPLNDKTTYSIVSSNLEGEVEGDLSQVYAIPNGENATTTLSNSSKKAEGQSVAVSEKDATVNGTIFNDMGIEPLVYFATNDAYGRTSASEKSLDQMAADAAQAIFTLRKRRFDLVTGELGEGVFGEGLEAAIEEMARIEEEYLSLFVGKVSRSYQTFNYTVLPVADKTSYVVARFSNREGMNDITSLEGDPVVVTLSPEKGVTKQGGENSSSSKKRNSSLKIYRVADMVQCKLFVAQSVLVSKRIPVFQFGETYSVVSE